MSLQKKLVLFLLILTVISMGGCKQKVTKNKAYYYEMGKENYAKGYYENSVESFKRVLEDFEGKSYRAESLFFIGYIYANELKDKPDGLKIAEKYYKTLLKEFPDHELATSAKVELDNLGKSPEEIIMNINPESLKK